MKFTGLSILTLLFTCQIVLGQKDLSGTWFGELESPGGALRFQVDFEGAGETLAGYLVNGPEQIKIPNTRWDGQELDLQIPHYDSRLQLQWDESQEVFVGGWTKTKGKDYAPTMNAKLSRNGTEPSNASLKAYLGRWQVQFDGDEDPAVAVIKPMKDDETKVWATFMTTTGDYRYLSGQIVDGSLELSVFDGAHAFLFRAKLDNDTMTGTFWSSLNWKQAWTAKRDGKAFMPNPYTETRFSIEEDLGAFRFPDLNGVPKSLNDKQFIGKPRLIHVFGSWCPNCHDAGLYLGELQKKYGDDLSILGLAFELTGDFERDAEQVKKFHEHHQTNYPTLIAGLADKAKATEAIPFLDRVRSYPTTIFLDGNGKLVDVHTGFTGPATGAAYESLKKGFESRIDQMINDWKSNSNKK